MKIIKGSTFAINAIAWAIWTGNAATSTRANCTGATVKGYFKERLTDLDADAKLTINGTVVSGPDGTVRIPVTAAQTNGMSQARLYFQGVVKLADGVTYIRCDVEEVDLGPSLTKTLP